MSDDVRVHLIVKGRVQGVFYRASAKERAMSLGLNGWVRNLYSGEVELMVEGEKKAVSTFIEWCKIGPPYAVVKDITIVNESPRGDMLGFEIRY